MQTVDRYQTKSLFALFPYAMILFLLFFNCRGKITSDNSQIKDEAEQNGREMDGQREREKRQQVCASPEEREREGGRLWQSEDTESSRVRKRKTGRELQLPLKLQLTQQPRQCQEFPVTTKHLYEAIGNHLEKGVWSDGRCRFARRSVMDLKWGLQHSFLQLCRLLFFKYTGSEGALLSLSSVPQNVQCDLTSYSLTF